MGWEHDKRKRVGKEHWGCTNNNNPWFSKGHTSTKAQREIVGNRAQQYHEIKNGEVEAIGTK